MKYRYVASKSDWLDSDEAWDQMCDYVRDTFTHVVSPTAEIIYFNAAPKEVIQMVDTLRVGTTSFNILTNTALEPSTHRE